MSCITTSSFSSTKSCGVSITSFKKPCICIYINNGCGHFEDEDNYIGRIYFDDSGSMHAEQIESDRENYNKFKTDDGSKEIYLYIPDVVELAEISTDDLCVYIENENINIERGDLGFIFDTGDRDNDCRPLNMFDFTNNDEGTYILDKAPFNFTKL